MKKRLYLLNRLICLMLLFSACSIDDKYDLSKEIDMTVGVGDGLSLPIGSTDKIMFTELIDTLETDIIKIDGNGYYSVYKSGTFTPETFRIDDVDIEIRPETEKKHYDFELVNLSENYDNLPLWVKEEMKNKVYPYVVHEPIDNITDFKINQSVPTEIKKLRSLTFKQPVKMLLEFSIYSENHLSDDLLEATDELHLLSDEETGFVIEVPEYINFAAEDNVKDGKLILNGVAKYDETSKSLNYQKYCIIESLDFSKLKDGFLTVVDGKIEINDELHARGYVESDTVFYEFEDITHIQSVDVKPVLSIDIMNIETAEGIFEPIIDPITEQINFNLGDDLEFLNNADFDFNDPQIFVTFNNPVNAQILADVSLKGYDIDGNFIDNSQISTELFFAADVQNKFYINRYNNVMEGYSTVVIPELNNLIKKIPNRLDVSLNAQMDNENYSTIVLGKDLEISGDYNIKIPMKFDAFSLEYTEEIDNVLGDDSEDITDYVTDLNSVTLTFDVYNTIPAEFTPCVVAYDNVGNVLGNIKVTVDGTVAEGNGMVNEVVSTPVKSSVKINLSVKNGELEYLEKLDLKFSGLGSGIFNSNEYLKVENIVITVDEPILVDLN